MGGAGPRGHRSAPVTPVLFDNGMETPGWKGSTHDLEVDETLRRVVIFFRVLAWAWMLTLVIITLATDDNVDTAVTIGAMALATVWVGVTWWAASARVLGTPWFVAVDGIVALGLGVASTIADAADFFHGGMPMSWLIVAAYAYGFWGAVPASIVLGVEQVLVHIADDKSEVGAAGSLVFLVFAVVVGWGFDALRAGERRLRETEQQLVDEQRATARYEERERLANQLHDSVLQSLLVMRRDAEDPQQIRYLARREERGLRRAIADLRSEHENSFRAALLKVCDDVEDTYRIEVESVIRDDPKAGPRLEAAIQAAKEALVNAAKHSGARSIDLYSEARSDQVTINVRDRGHGFDDEARKTGGGFDNSLISRVREHGGSVSVVTAPGQGTEVTITMGLDE